MRRAHVAQTVADLIGFAKTITANLGASRSVALNIVAHDDDPGSEAAELWSHAPLLYRPRTGTEALYIELGDERVVIATKDRAHQVEVADGEVVLRAMGNAAAFVKLKPDGTAEVHAAAIKLGAAAEHGVALANLVIDQLSALKSAINGAAVGSSDGGAAFKSALLSALSSWPQSVSAAKTKAE